MIVLVAVPKLESINSCCSHHQMVAFIFFSHMCYLARCKSSVVLSVLHQNVYMKYLLLQQHTYRTSNTKYSMKNHLSTNSSGLKISTQISFGIASSIEWSHRSILRKRCAKSKTKSKSISHSADAISVSIPYHIWKAWE